ncbi:DMD isoform 6, partial [Pan troglodytes]
MLWWEEVEDCYEREDVQKKTFTKWVNAQFSKATQKEIEKQKVHLKSITEVGEALKTVLGKKETLVEDKLSLLNSNWIAVTSRAEEWLNLLLEYQKHMETFD